MAAVSPWSIPRYSVVVVAVISLFKVRQYSEGEGSFCLQYLKLSTFDIGLQPSAIFVRHCCQIFQLCCFNAVVSGGSGYYYSGGESSSGSYNNNYGGQLLLTYGEVDTIIELSTSTFHFFHHDGLINARNENKILQTTNTSLRNSKHVYESIKIHFPDLNNNNSDDDTTTVGQQKGQGRKTPPPPQPTRRSLEFLLSQGRRGDMMFQMSRREGGGGGGGEGGANTTIPTWMFQPPAGERRITVPLKRLGELVLTLSDVPICTFRDMVNFGTPLRMRYGFAFKYDQLFKFNVELIFMYDESVSRYDVEDENFMLRVRDTIKPEETSNIMMNVEGITPIEDMTVTLVLVQIGIDSANYTACTIQERLRMLGIKYDTTSTLITDAAADDDDPTNVDDSNGNGNESAPVLEEGVGHVAAPDDNSNNDGNDEAGVVE